MKYLSILAIAVLLSCSSGNDSPDESVANFDIIAIDVSNLNNETPIKGDEIAIKIQIQNTSSKSGKAIVSPKLSSSRFSDYKNVTLPTVEKQIAAGETATLTLNVGPFFQDAYNGKHYALGRGEYFIESVNVNDVPDTDYSGRVFKINSSNVLLVPVLYNASYLNKTNANVSMKKYLEDAFTRRVELYSKSDTYTDYDGGFDEMMGVKQLFYPIQTINVSDHPLDDGLCEKAIALGGETLGLLDDWKGPVGTQPENHGFDYLMVATPDSFGGVACGWINVQISGLFDFDLSINRAQIVMIHETSHLFGSPHCDPLQGYVMCSGEKHRKYLDQGIYVYHEDSKNQMSNRWD
ncbi:hypothetical protein [Leeuwenhoekiella sp. H156]|uniref:hypothetical protein n=1 Tax=Leeuwenhoekiella sp. H156 TaxID=3450128 RepID=UPI003FA40B24